MNKNVFVIFVLFFCSCVQDRTLFGDWEARDSAGSYSEFAVFESFIQIYSDIGGNIPLWDYEIDGDSLLTPILNYKIDWIIKDSLVLRNKKFSIELRRIKQGVCLSEVEGQPEYYQPFIDSFYERRDTK